MINLSLVIRKSMPNADGSYNIKLMISAKRQVAYMSTRFNVDSANQFINGRVRSRPDARVVNLKLNQLLNECEEAVDELSNFDLSAKEAKAYIEKRLCRPTTLQAYAKDFIRKISNNGQDSYAKNMGYSLKQFTDCFGDSFPLGRVSHIVVEQWERWLDNNGYSTTTINIRMSHLKALINSAIKEDVVEYKKHPFLNYHMPTKAVRDICISKEELTRLRDAEFEGVAKRRLSVARDLFMLSFYCAGINLTDLIDATFDSDVLTFVRKKTATKKKGADIRVSMTIQPEARAIIDKYIDEDGKLDLGYHYTDYGQFRSFVTKSLNRIGEMLGFEKKLMFYSARKTFVQFGSELGIPLYILEYAIGQTIKEANNRPVFNYLKVMRRQADLAIRTIIDYPTEVDETNTPPLPEWARRRV